VVFKPRDGLTLIELFFVLFLCTVLFASVFSFSAVTARVSDPGKERLLMIAIRNDISSTSAEAMLNGYEEKMLIRSGETFCGYRFQSDLVLRFTPYGQLQKGAKVELFLEGEGYLLTIEPVTAKVSIKKTG